MARSILFRVVPEDQGGGRPAPPESGLTDDESGIGAPTGAEPSSSGTKVPDESTITADESGVGAPSAAKDS